MVREEVGSRGMRGSTHLLLAFVGGEGSVNGKHKLQQSGKKKKKRKGSIHYSARGMNIGQRRGQSNQGTLYFNNLELSNRLLRTHTFIYMRIKNELNTPQPSRLAEHTKTSQLLRGSFLVDTYQVLPSRGFVTEQMRSSQEKLGSHTYVHGYGRSRKCVAEDRVISRTRRNHTQPAG